MYLGHPHLMLLQSPLAQGDGSGHEGPVFLQGVVPRGSATAVRALESLQQGPLVALRGRTGRARACPTLVPFAFGRHAHVTSDTGQRPRQWSRVRRPSGTSLSILRSGGINEMPG